MQLNVFISTHGVLPLPRRLGLQCLQALPNHTIRASRDCHLETMRHIEGLVAPQGDIGCSKLRSTMQTNAA